jgi:hypothetical protein
VLVVALLVSLGLKRPGWELPRSPASCWRTSVCLERRRVLVQLALASHLLVFRKLAQHRS